jgi:hypothetical protein
LDGRGGAAPDQQRSSSSAGYSMGRSFRDSLKLLEADIQHANSL